MFVQCNDKPGTQDPSLNRNLEELGTHHVQVCSSQLSCLKYNILIYRCLEPT